MQKINLRDLYPDAYKTDVFVDVAEEVLTAIRDQQQDDAAYERRKFRYKAYYSLNRGDGIENDAINQPPTPEEILEQKQLKEEVYAALMQLPAIQARRIYARFYLGMRVAEIARIEGADRRRVWDSIRRGLKKLARLLDTVRYLLTLPQIGGEKMNEYTFDYVERNRLDAFCKTVLRNEAITYLSELARRRDREKPLDTLPQAEMDKLCTLDEYPSDSFTFSAFGYDLHIRDEQVAGAFASLPEQEQQILILRFVAAMADGEIGGLVGMSRSAVQRHRTSTLKQLRVKLMALMPGGRNAK